MILLGRKVSFRKILIPGLIILISVFYGCETSEDPGIDYPLNSNVNVRFKEFILPAANIYIDSLRTDGAGQVLVGSYTDPISGTVKTEGYMALSYVLGSLPGNLIQSNYSYDSVRISLLNSPSLKNSGTANQSLIFNQLVDTLQNDLIYLSRTKKQIASQVGSHQFTVTNSEDTTYCNSILSDAFGIGLFQKGLDAGTMAIVDWPSLGISADIGSELISSISLTSDTSRVYLYVTNPKGIVTSINDQDTSFRDTTYRAEFVFSSIHFTNVDRSGSQFNSISEKTDFDLPDGRTLIDPLYGVSTAFNVDQLNSFFDENENILLNDVSIIFDLDAGQVRDTLSQFMSFIRKEDLGFFGPARSSSSSSFQNIIMSDASYLGSSTPQPSFSRLGSDSTRLLLNGTLFFQSVYQEFRENQVLQFQPLEDVIIPISEFVLISPVDITLRRTIFKKDGIKLRVYYTKVDE